MEPDTDARGWSEMRVSSGALDSTWPLAPTIAVAA
jgi:hypothetical protein